jgi:hypothetical protein
MRYISSKESGGGGHPDGIRSRPKVATQANNLFGYGTPGAGDLSDVIEVNLPLGRFRRSLQGAFVRNLKTNSIVFAIVTK